jgi:hypothetical protein
LIKLLGNEELQALSISIKLQDSMLRKTEA